LLQGTRTNLWLDLVLRLLAALLAIWATASLLGSLPKLAYFTGMYAISRQKKVGGLLPQRLMRNQFDKDDSS
jgi:hypothetical protein